MARITGNDLAHEISLLPRNRMYHYIYSGTKSVFSIESVNTTTCHITFRRWNPSKGETRNGASTENISGPMVWRLANAISEGVPVNCEKVFGASYNSRSVLESMVALTPCFWFCYPGRIQSTSGRYTIEPGHKHIVWLPDNPHEPGVLCRAEIEYTMNEIPAQTIYYDDVRLPPSNNAFSGVDEDLRQHTIIQVALYLIGLSLGYKTFIAQNDQNIIYGGKPLADREGMIRRLDDTPQLSSFADAALAGRFIDVIWFKNSHLMPAVLEVEHSTTIISGLDRMKEFHDHAPFGGGGAYWVIVADDDRRDAVMELCQREQYRDMKPHYMPYSSVYELQNFCSSRMLKGVTNEFLENFMEPTLTLPVSC